MESMNSSSLARSLSCRSRGFLLRLETSISATPDIVSGRARPENVGRLLQMDTRSPLERRWGRCLLFVAFATLSDVLVDFECSRGGGGSCGKVG